jgi:hypothetical protein
MPTMTYKGSDLDLRTPCPAPAYGGLQPDSRARSEPGRSPPIVVDDVVHAACNVAHDAAMFLGGGPVSPVHMMHGLTRVQAAAQALERHGIDGHALRRASAAAVAGEAPALGERAGAAPRTSPELDRLLRQAAALAAVREGAFGAPVSVADVLRAVLAAGREQPAAALLLGAAADPDALWRWGTEAQAPAPGLVPATVAVESLAARVSELEGAVRALADDLGRAVAVLAERFEAIRAFAPGPDLSGRLSSLETALSAQSSMIAEAAGGPVRLARLEEALNAHGQALEEANRKYVHDSQEVFAAVARIGANQQTLAGNLEAWRLDSSGDISIVSNRLQEMEQALRAVLPRPRPEQPPADQAPLPGNAAAGGDEAQAASGLRRWLTGTGRVLPASWREDMNTLRETLRARRRNGGT